MLSTTSNVSKEFIMAMSVGGGNGRGKGRYRPMAEINVTPLVDVMLVLLIVFMVTAPMLTSGVNVDLPKTNAAPVNQDNTPLTVSIKPDGSVYFQNDQVQLPELVAKLQAVAQDNKDRRIFVRGDKDVNYGTVMQVMGTITQGGFTKVALLAEQPGPAVAGSDAKTAPAASSAKPGKR
ncbi:TolR protein [Granulibacter bethesdensis]|uniref:TolR protein n=2 Tax=Granulibacter bethesdensis TaxID=364410 RepID=Q0BT50_GRABC|nr:TolR protein [Granulibacter bethesdensis CGDNIH1]AHJ69102.1 TolR protein [Granulibacter bethesdensis]APH51822.1 TolR protein [Granulibacter bethesdensis]APH64513.1 TolR protein [Granulibacter bethesdensis]